jgi:hypothetical protein
LVYYSVKEENHFLPDLNEIEELIKKYIFAAKRKIPKVKEGDILAILCAGAYGYSMASR